MALTRVKSAGVNPDNGNAQYFTIDNSGNQVITEDLEEAVRDAKMFLVKTAIPDFFGGFGANLHVRSSILTTISAQRVTIIGCCRGCNEK